MNTQGQAHFRRWAATSALLLCSIPAQAGSLPPFDVQGLIITPNAGALAGYSSNPDEKVNGESSAFSQYDASLEAAMKSDDFRFKMEVNGTILNYEDLKKDYRWLYEAKASAETQLGKGDLLEFDARHRRDNLDDRYDELSHRVRAFWTHEAKDFEFKLGASFRNKDFLEPASHNEFDYLMPGAELTLRALPKAEVSPFAVLRAAKLDYLNQIESIIDRDAMNYSLTGGLRWQPSKTIEIEAGARYNLREIEDQAHGRANNVFADLQLHWKPSDRIDVRGALWREFAEPYKSDGVVADQINSQLALVFKPGGRFEFESKAMLQWEHEIGTDTDSIDIEISAAGYYEINDALRAYLKGRQLWEHDHDTADDRDKRSATTEIFVGLETTF